MSSNPNKTMLQSAPSPEQVARIDGISIEQAQMQTAKTAKEHAALLDTFLDSLQASATLDAARIPENEPDFTITLNGASVRKGVSRQTVSNREYIVFVLDTAQRKQLDRYMKVTAANGNPITLETAVPLFWSDGYKPKMRSAVLKFNQAIEAKRNKAMSQAEDWLFSGKFTPPQFADAVVKIQAMYQPETV